MNHFASAGKDSPWPAQSLFTVPGVTRRCRLATRWDDIQLNSVIAYLQRLHYDEMPACAPFPARLPSNVLHDLLLVFYPDYVREAVEEASNSMPEQAIAGQPPHYPAKDLGQIDLDENWDNYVIDPDGHFRRNELGFLPWGFDSRDEMRALMLRRLYEETRQTLPPDVALHTWQTMSRVARALYIGELATSAGLENREGHLLAYPLPETTRGFNHLFDYRHHQEAIARISQNIARLSDEGNAPLLMFLIATVEQQQSRIRADFSGEIPPPLDTFVGHYWQHLEKLREKANNALEEVWLQDLQEVAVLTQRCREYARQMDDVPACAHRNNGFRYVLEEAGQDADALWTLAVRTIAAEMETAPAVVADFLGEALAFSELLVTGLRDGFPPEAALAAAVYAWRKDFRLFCGLVDAAIRLAGRKAEAVACSLPFCLTSKKEFL